MGRRPDPQEEIQDAEVPEARRRGGWERQEACLTVLPGGDGALPYRAVPVMGEEPAHRSALVVPVPNADLGPLIQGVPRVESTAEDSVGRCAEGDWEVEDPGPPCRWEVRLGGTGLPLRYGCGKTGSGRERRGERGVGMSSGNGGSGKRRGGRRRRRGAGDELPLFLPTPSFMESAGED